MSNDFRSLNISETYDSIIHVENAVSQTNTSGQLDSNSRKRLYDGAGNPSAIYLGRDCNGVTICGPLSCTGKITSDTNYDNITISTTSPTLTFSETDQSPVANWQINLEGNTFYIKRGGNNEVIITPTTTTIENNTVIGGTLYTGGALTVAAGGLAVTGGITLASGSTINATGGNLNIATITATGQINAATFNSTSSIKHKKDVKPLENALDIISKLQGVRYTWKDTNKDDIGLIAEDVNDVLPELVSKNESGEVLGIDYGKITAVLIEAIKELLKNK